MPSKKSVFYLNILYLITLAGCAHSAPSSDRSPAQAGGTVLWDEWYGVTVGAKRHYEYYNEKIELKEDKVFYKSDTWKKEEDYINRESLGEVATADEAVTPLFFNFHATYRSNETQIDGTVSPSHMLTVKVRKGEQDGPVVKKSISPKVFFSSFFPIWLGKHVNELKTGKELSYSTILEDGTDPDFSTVRGSAKLMEPDDYALKSKTVKVNVSLGESHSTWWIDSRGAAVRIELPETKTTVEKITKSRAMHFLE